MCKKISKPDYSQLENKIRNSFTNRNLRCNFFDKRLKFSSAFWTMYTNVVLEFKGKTEHYLSITSITEDICYVEDKK